MNKRHPGAEHTVRAVCADFMALGNHGLVFGGGSEPAASHREAAAAPYNDTFFGAVPAVQAAVCTRLYGLRRLFDGYAADHAVPVVIGTAQVVCAGLCRREKEVLLVARLHQYFAMLAVQHVGIVDLGGGEEHRGGEFVGFFAMILEVQLVMNAALERQMIGLELVIDHDDVDLYRCWCGVRQSRACEGNRERKPATACVTVTPHEHQFLPRLPDLLSAGS
jgi:hypothetical protein